MGSDEVTLSWLDAVDERLVDEVSAMVAAVVERGGAVGWLSMPARDELAGWLAGWCDADGRRLVVCRVDGVVRAIGGWVNLTVTPMRHIVELTKIMATPGYRGLGLGRRVVDMLLADVRERGFELAILGVRGNNHPARRLYESVGFRIWGVLPRGLAVGGHRFDDVRMYRELNPPQDVLDHGLAPTGPGAG